MPSQVFAIPPVSAAVRAYNAGAAQATDFKTLVSSAAESSLQTLRRSELVSARGVAGTADVQDVVQAAAAAELTVQTMTQLRDKVVSAYMDVLRMAV
jgi:flagellar hook-basal body complex protein FliE